MKTKSTLERALGLWWQYRTGNGNDSCFLRAKKRKACLTISSFKNKTQCVVQDNEHTFSPRLTIHATLLSRTPGHQYSLRTWLCTSSTTRLLNHQIMQDFVQIYMTEVHWWLHAWVGITKMDFVCCLTISLIKATNTYLNSFTAQGSLVLDYVR